MKPRNTQIDIEALKVQLRQEFEALIRQIVEEEIDEALTSQDDDSGVDDGDSTTDPGDGSEDGDTGSGTQPFIEVRFKNNNGVYMKPTELSTFGTVLVSADGTTTVNVQGKIVDDQKGIEKYKIRIKRID